MDIRKNITEHARRFPQQEVCGLILRGVAGSFVVMECVNVADDPTNHFKIAPSVYLEAIRHNQLLTYYHSHISGSSRPSEHDKCVSEELGVPNYIYSLEEDSVECYVPAAVRKTPLEGRNYLPLVFDCASLVQDYYEFVLSVPSPPIPRTWDTIVKGYPGILNYAKAMNMTREMTPATHDVIVMNIRSQHPNHAAVYLGDGIILHQLDGKPALKEVYTNSYWEHNTTHILRYSNLQQQ